MPKTVLDFRLMGIKTDSIFRQAMQRRIKSSQGELKTHDNGDTFDCLLDSFLKSNEALHRLSKNTKKNESKEKDDDDSQSYHFGMIMTENEIVSDLEILFNHGVGIDNNILNTLTDLIVISLNKLGAMSDFQKLIFCEMSLTCCQEFNNDDYCNTSDCRNEPTRFDYITMIKNCPIFYSFLLEILRTQWCNYMQFGMGYLWMDKNSKIGKNSHSSNNTIWINNEKILKNNKTENFRNNSRKKEMDQICLQNWLKVNSNLKKQKNKDSQTEQLNVILKIVDECGNDTAKCDYQTLKENVEKGKDDSGNITSIDNLMKLLTKCSKQNVIVTDETNFEMLQQLFGMKRNQRACLGFEFMIAIMGNVIGNLLLRFELICLDGNGVVAKNREQSTQLE